MLASVRGLFGGRYFKLCRGNSNIKSFGEHVDQKNLRKENKQQGEANKESQKSEMKGDHKHHKPKKGQNDDPSTAAHNEVTEQSIIKTAEGFLTNLDIKKPKVKAVKDHPIGKTQHSTQTKPRLLSINETKKLIEKKKAPNTEQSTEIDIEKLSLQEIILSPMERYKPSVSQFHSENGGFS